MIVLIITNTILMNNEKAVLELILPTGIFEWFDVASCSKDENNLTITLEEKNIPPITDDLKDKTIKSKGFTDITITDFPIRGRRTLITFRRRYWQVEGQKELLKRDIQIAFPGTQLENEFAVFLKEDGGRQSGLSNFYRKVSLPPTQRI